MNLAMARQALNEAQRHARDAESRRGSLAVQIANLEEQLETCSTSEDRRRLRGELERAKDELADAAHKCTVTRQAEARARAQLYVVERLPQERQREIETLRRQLQACNNRVWTAEAQVQTAKRDLAEAERRLTEDQREHDAVAARLATLEAETQTETAPQAA